MVDVEHTQTHVDLLGQRTNWKVAPDMRRHLTDDVSTIGTDQMLLLLGSGDDREQVGETCGGDGGHLHHLVVVVRVDVGDAAAQEGGQLAIVLGWGVVMDSPLLPVV